MSSTNATFSAMSRTLTQLGKAIRQERLLKTQETERQQRTKILNHVAQAMNNRQASPRSLRIALTGFNEYYRVAHNGFQPEPNAKLTPAAPGVLLADVLEQPVTWLWQDYLPLGAITLLQGEPGSGKSLLALHIAACVTSGRALPGGTLGAQGNVILVAPQDHIGYTIKSRLVAAGGDPARVLLLNTVEQVDSDHVKIDDRPFSLARDLFFLEEALTRTHAALLIIDSLDTCRPDELRQTLPALAQIAERTGCAILLVRPIAPHQVAPAQKPGSIELLTAVRSSLLILSDPDDEQRQRLLVVTKHSLCEQPGILSYQLTTQQQGILTIDCLGTYAQPLPPYEESPVPLSHRNLSLLRQVILSTLHDCAAPLNARSLSTISGFTYDHVRKTLQRMLHAGQLLSPARGLYTTPGHPCLEERAAAHTSTPPAEYPETTVSSVPPNPENTPPADPSNPPVPPDEVDQRSITTETPDPSVTGTPPSPASEHDLANGSPKPPVSNLEVDSCSIPTQAPDPIAPTVPIDTPTRPRETALVGHT